MTPLLLEPPEEVIKSELFLHQKEGLWWLAHRENSSELPPFWEEKNGCYMNLLTNCETKTRPEPLRGGTFADDMGSGKTLTLISLIAFDKYPTTLPFSISDEVQEEKSCCEKPTLIVCPSSVLSTWTTQLKDHTTPGSLKVYMYYGNRTKNAEELKKCDIVLTTYNILANEDSRLDFPAKKVNWWRVILDEAHVIKHWNTGKCRAVCHLKTNRRWVVTGTPIQNDSSDLFSVMVFLRLNEPFSFKSGYWKFYIQQPLDTSNETGLSRLQVIRVDSFLLKAISLCL